MATFALVAAADFNKEDFMARHARGQFDCVIAVDGGYTHLESASVVPQVVVGDFDSLGYQPDHPCVVRHPEIKDKSDLELALAYALDYGADALYAYGCLAGRLDHTLAAIQAMAAYSEKGLKVAAIGCGAVDTKADFENGFALQMLTGPGQVDFVSTEQRPLEGGLSVFALNDCVKGVTERGLFYPLEDTVLTNRTSLGLSNQFTGKDAYVHVEKGTLCLVYPNRYLQ